MGSERRLRARRAGAAVAWLSIALSACSRPSAPDAAAAERRPLLQPPDRAAIAREEAKRTVIFDEAGKLLPSDQTAAELVLPRGLAAVGASDGIFRYSTTKVPFEALDHYFGDRLLTGQLERPTKDVVRFVWASIKAAPRAPLVTVRVMRLSGDRGCDILIEQGKPREELLTAVKASPPPTQRPPASNP